MNVRYKLQENQIQTIRETLADYGYPKVTSALNRALFNLDYDRSIQTLNRVFKEGSVSGDFALAILILCKYDERINFLESLSQATKVLSLQARPLKIEPWLEIFAQMYFPKIRDRLEKLQPNERLPFLQRLGQSLEQILAENSLKTDL